MNPTVLRPAGIPARLALCLLVSAALVRAAERPAAPNFIVIMADDLGYSDIGAYGSEIATPHLDALARGGVRFSQFYTTPKCFPSRAALLTGLYPHQTGLGRRPEKLENCVTLAEVLRSAGYRTYMVGKWHGKDLPVQRGFERHFGLVDGQVNHFNPGRQRPGEPPPSMDKGERTWAIDGQVFKPYTPEDPKFYSTDAFTDHALRYLDENPRGQPFFLYVAYTAPHYPIQAWPEDIAKYRGKYRAGWDRIRLARFERQKTMGLVPADATLPPRGNTTMAVVRKTGPWMPRFWDEQGQFLPWEQVADHDNWDLKMAVYAAMVDRMDQNIGRLMARLRETGQADNTLVVFLSDNGASGGTHHYGATPAEEPRSGPGPMDSFHTYDSPWADVSNTPFTGYKDTCYEGGNATPFLLHWPAGITFPAGTVSREIGSILDLAPTLYELAGASYPKIRDGKPLPALEGHSLVGLLRGQPHRGPDTLFWEYNEDRAARRGDWKVVGLPRKPWRLYHLGRDRAEQHDVAAAHPEILRDLVARWEAWSRRVGVDKLPPKKQTED